MNLLKIAYKNRILNKYSLIFFTLYFSFLIQSVQAQEKPEFDDISIIVQIEGIPYTYNIAALYSTEGKLYVAVEELFQVLVIPCNINNTGDSLTGFIDKEERTYEINNHTKQINFDAKSYNITDDIIKNMGMIYLESFVFEKVFGLHLSFNFRSLSIKVTSDFELPILKKQRLEKSRNSLQTQNDEFPVDQTIKRKYHLFRYGNIDWSLMSSQSPGSAVDSRIGISLGTELLFGEADAFLNFSDKSKPDPRQQQFYWRWVDNEKSIVRQVLAGNISSKTIASVNAPVHGTVITNTPTTIRKAKGEYIISDVTQPDWIVELYLNNSLIAFTKADAAGQFTFKVPIIYGFTVLKLKFYGPMGEEKLEERVMNVPASFMPSGVFEYKLSGGVLQNGDDTKFGRVEGNYGISRSFTIGGGIEYLSSFTTINNIPFVSFSMLPIRKLILSGEYADKVRSRVLMNFYLPANAMLEIDYSKYEKGQKAILFNYLEERKIGLSVPLRFKSISGSSRLYYKQNVFDFFNYNMVEMMFSAFYKQINANVSTNANWISDKPVYINANAAVSVRLPKNYAFRPSAQFNLSTMEVMSYKAELEKKVSQAGFFSMSFERNIVSDFNSLNFSFKYDFSFAQTNISFRTVNKDISLLESVRGGIALDDKNSRIFPNQQSMVGRGGLAFIAFVDVNHNNIYDPGERKADFLSVKVNGGRSVYSEKDSIIRVMGLEPFLYYNVELNDKDFEFITWRIHNKNLRVLIDPNQFKTIEVPISPVAEISGNVIFRSDSKEEGLGRVIVNVFDKKDGSLAARIITESDGYVNHLGLLPGDYYAQIDSIQLFRLEMNAAPSRLDFTIKTIVEGDVFNGLDFVLTNKKSETMGMLSHDSLINNRLVTDTVLMQRKLTMVDNKEKIDLLLAKVTQKIHFDVGKAVVLPIYKTYLKQVAELLKNNPEVNILLEGLCDIDGSVIFNQKLSVKRATSVRNELIKLGVDGKRIEVVGLGSLKPLNTNSNAAEKSFNRRVEFKVNLKTSSDINNGTNTKTDTDNKTNADTKIGGVTKIGVNAKKKEITKIKDIPGHDNLVIKDTISLINTVNKTDDNKDQFIGNICNESGSYYVQCGVFKNKNAAVKLALKIKGKTDVAVGIEIYNTLYKVQLGCSTDKKEMGKLMDFLKEKKVCDNMFLGVRK
ncbi:MAG: OmpA family protein [Bacteroidales bacterium]